MLEPIFFFFLVNTRSLIKLVFSLNKESNQSFWVFDFTVFENFFPDEIVSMCISDNDEFSGMKQFIFLIEKIRNDNIYSLNPDTIFYSLFFFLKNLILTLLQVIICGVTSEGHLQLLLSVRWLVNICTEKWWVIVNRYTNVIFVYFFLGGGGHIFTRRRKSSKKWCEINNCEVLNDFLCEIHTLEKCAVYTSHREIRVIF